MKDIIYFDASCGVSGDMFAGALIDLGADFEKIKKDVESLNIGIELRYEKSITYGISAGKFTVIDTAADCAADAENEHHEHCHRHLSNIKEILYNSALSADIKDDSFSVFRLIAEAEAKVHGTDAESVHFHEVGALDSIGDIVASVSALRQFSAEKIYSSPINTGSGVVKCQHGVLPVPAPASLKLLCGIPAFSDGTKTELATPTGITLLKYFVTKFTDMPKMTLKAEGCGMGTRDIGRANIFRAILGEEF